LRRPKARKAAEGQREYRGNNGAIASRSISTIALARGFNDLAHFGKRFRKHFGDIDEKPNAEPPAPHVSLVKRRLH
jgi:AraC-like DNA-binding protein